MNEFWILILVAFCATNSLDKAESVKVKLEETPLKTFDEIFGEGWWDKGEAEDLKTPVPTNFGQNVHRQIDRQNTQNGQIEPNSIDQNITESDHFEQIEPSTEQNLPLTESDHSGQINANSTDQNSPLTESDHFGQIEPNSTDQNPPLTESDHRKIVEKFLVMKDEFKQKGKSSTKERTKVENEIAKDLQVNRSKIYKWKKEFGISSKKEKEERKHLVEKFDQMKAELKRAGFKNSYSNQIDKTVAKELGLNFTTIYAWKRKLAQPAPQDSHSKQKEWMKCYYEIKDKNPEFRDEDIAKMLKIGTVTLYRWKKQFNRQQFQPNSVVSVEENAAANVQEIGNSNLAGSI